MASLLLSLLIYIGSFDYWHGEFNSFNKCAKEQVYCTAEAADNNIENNDKLLLTTFYSQEQVLYGTQTGLSDLL